MLLWTTRYGVSLKRLYLQRLSIKVDNAGFIGWRDFNEGVEKGEQQMGSFITISEALSMAAYHYPAKVGAKDLSRTMTFSELNERCWVWG